tara:strand:- start:392 stop:1009 length:618 start_codon:yes stop_codon:yes gene_type:complete
MSFEPQLPQWGLDDFKKHLDKLIEYHNWLKDTATKTGLISKKTDQFIWDEFIVHSLYFAKLLKKYKNLKECEIIDLGTGAGIPGIPISIVNKTNVSLVDNKQKRIYELERLVKILNLKNAIPKKKDANTILKDAKNSVIVMRCYVSTSNVLKLLEKKQFKENNLTIFVSSNSKSSDIFNKMFHVKQEKFFINKNNFRYIDVITDM